MTDSLNFCNPMASMIPNSLRPFVHHHHQGTENDKTDNHVENAFHDITRGNIAVDHLNDFGLQLFPGFDAMVGLTGGFLPDFGAV